MATGKTGTLTIRFEPGLRNSAGCSRIVMPYRPDMVAAKNDKEIGD